MFSPVKLMLQSMFSTVKMNTEVNVQSSHINAAVNAQHSQNKYCSQCSAKSKPFTCSTFFTFLSICKVQKTHLCHVKQSLKFYGIKENKSARKIFVRFPKFNLNSNRCMKSRIVSYTQIFIVVQLRFKRP